MRGSSVFAAVSFLGMVYLGFMINIVKHRPDGMPRISGYPLMENHSKCEKHGEVHLRRIGVQNAPVHTGPGYTYLITKYARYFTPIEVIDWDVRPPKKVDGYDELDRRHWNKISIDENEGWIFKGHTMSYYGGPDIGLEWDIKRPDKILQDLYSKQYMRLEGKIGVDSRETAKMLINPMKEAEKYHDLRARYLIESILKGNMQEAQGVNYYTVAVAVDTLASLRSKASLSTLVECLRSYNGVGDYDVRERAANAMLRIVEKNGDLGDYAQNASLEILRDGRYNDNCKKTASTILSTLGKRIIP